MGKETPPASELLHTEAIRTLLTMILGPRITDKTSPYRGTHLFRFWEINPRGKRHAGYTYVYDEHEAREFMAAWNRDGDGYTYEPMPPTTRHLDRPARLKKAKRLTPRVSVRAS